MSNVPSSKIMSDKLSQDCIDTIIEYSGISITSEYFQKIIDSGQLNIDSIIEFSPTDTVERENLLNSLSKTMIEANWPTYRDGDLAFKEFYNKLELKAKELGFEVIAND